MVTVIKDAGGQLEQNTSETYRYMDRDFISRKINKKSKKSTAIGGFKGTIYAYKEPRSLQTPKR